LEESRFFSGMVNGDRIMATAHLPRKPATVSPPPQSTPQQEPPRGRGGLWTDWIALLLWLGCFALIAGLVLIDTVVGLIRHLWGG
jgi:hypothetical protein